jgi:TPR repeat protein
VTRDAVGARAYYANACDRGLANGCGDLARLEAHYGTPAQVLPLGQAACEKGGFVGCAVAAEILRTGSSGVPEDLQKARSFFERACAFDHAESCHAFAELLETGEAGDRDGVRAQRVYRHACLVGSGRACHRLAELHPGVPAIEYRALACERGLKGDCLEP